MLKIFSNIKTIFLQRKYYLIFEKFSKFFKFFGEFDIFLNTITHVNRFFTYIQVSSLYVLRTYILIKDR